MQGTQLVARDYVKYIRNVSDRRCGRASGRHGSGRDVENYAAFHVVDAGKGKIEGIICDRDGRTVLFTAAPMHSGIVAIKVEAGRAGWGGELTRIGATQRIGRILRKAVIDSLNALEKFPGFDKSLWDGFYLENTRRNAPVSERDRMCFDKAQREGYMPPEFVEFCIKWHIRVYERVKVHQKVS